MKIQIENDHPIEEILIRMKPILNDYAEWTDCPDCEELVRKANER